jgi:NAD(P)H-hydrate epimerase
MRSFDESWLKNLYKPDPKSEGDINGQAVIIGGSKLFHGAPILSLKVASRIVDMVYFASPEPSVGNVANQIKSELMSFVWVPWDEVDEYIKKSDIALVGPGFMRYESESTPEDERNHIDDDEGRRTREITETLLNKHPNKKWVIDAGSLQVIEPELIMPKAVITPNQKEYKHLFGDMDCQDAAKKFNCTIIKKDDKALVCSPEESVVIDNENVGLTKGGMGDVLAGLVTALYAKNDSFLAASSAAYLSKKAASELNEKVGTTYNADDLANQIPKTYKGSLN